MQTLDAKLSIQTDTKWSKPHKIKHRLKSQINPNEGNVQNKI